jgi:hypothetical protein
LRLSASTALKSLVPYWILVLVKRKQRETHYHRIAVCEPTIWPRIFEIRDFLNIFVPEAASAANISVNAEDPELREKHVSTC